MASTTINNAILTGTPTAPTAPISTNTTQIATTAFVHREAITKAPLASPAFTGIPRAPTALTTANTTQIATTAFVQAGMKLKAPLANPTFTGTVSGISKTMVSLGNVDNTSDVSKPVSTAQQTALNLKAPLASPAFTGIPVAPSALTTTNTTQIATTAFVQEVTKSKAPLASPTFTGTVSGITKTMVGL